MNSEIIPYSCDIPAFEEISIRSIWNRLTDDDYFINHFPDYPKN